MLKLIEIPNYIRIGIKKMNTEFERDINLLVMDTETVKGKPFCIQMYDGLKLEFKWQKNEDVLDSFFLYLKSHTFPNKTNLVFWHGLHYDIGVLFHKHHEQFTKNQFTYKSQKYNAYCDIKCGKIVFADIYFGKNHRVKLLDTFRFTMTSLEKSCVQLELPIKKMKRPEYIGEREPTKEELPYFIEYASTDVYALWGLARWVLKIHEEVNTSISLSIPHMGSKVLRTKFMRPKDIIKFPPNEACVNSILSYHGGKNEFFYDHPVLIDKAYSYDIISAYPWAMSILPGFISGKYQEVNELNKKYFGIYEVSGTYKKCIHNHLYNHTFQPLCEGEFDNVCLTSPEIFSALKHKELKIKKISGHVYIPNKNERTPLKDFVSYYFKQKSDSEKNSLPYLLAKLLLNSLYGKFIQTTDYDRKETIIARLKTGEEISFEEIKYRAGGLFNPFIASLITGLVRSKIHDIEHDYKSVHCATDGIFCLKEADTKNELGELKYENKGPLLIIRNKLYIHFYEGINPYDFGEILLSENKKENKEILIKKSVYKYALHGFQSDLETLIKLWINKENNYKIKRMVNIRESLKNINMKLTPLMFHEFEKTLEIDWNTFEKIKNREE